MPAPSKRRGVRQDNRPQRGGAGLVLMPRPDAAEVVVPPLPAGAGAMLAATKEKWDSFWLSTVAVGLDPVDLPIVERWILAYDEWRRALHAFRRKRIVQGSTGQAVLNPLSTWVQSRESQLEKAERELAMGLKGRASLGLTLGQAAKTMAELNRMTEEDPSGNVVEVEALDDVEAELIEEDGTS